MSIYSIKEDAERFRNVDYRAGNRESNRVYIRRGSKDLRDGLNRDDRDKSAAYASGNMFESLAKTNPELFDKTKLEALQHSEDLVKDFNEYMASVYGNDIERFGKFVRSIEHEYDNDKIRNQFQMKFNISLHGALYERYKDLIEKHNMSEDDAARIVTQEFFPESLSEQAIRDCLNTRIANNRCLTDSLTTMLKQNYAMLNLSKAEAKALMDDLADNSKNHEAIAKIRDFLRDPKLLQKFKLGEHNYDFRSIGGGVLFLSKNDDIQFCEHPSKNLNLIFKYDAIVNAHGSQMTDEYGNPTDATASTAKKIKENRELAKRLQNHIRSIIRIIGLSRDTSRQFGHIVSELRDIDNSMNSLDSMDDANLLYMMRHTRVLLVDLHNNSNVFSEKGKQELLKSIDSCYKIYQLINAEKDLKQAIRDGQAANWTMEPISTLSKSNLSRTVDIVRALKEEGFKKVFIGSCNPGGFTLPKDLTQDKDFKVYYGTTSVLKEYFGTDMDNLISLESYIDQYLADTNSPYTSYSLNELYEEYDLLCQLYPINEGIVDKLKEFFKRAAQIIAEIWKRIINFIKNLAVKIVELIQNAFGMDALGKKTKKPIEVTTIQMDGDKATVRTTQCNTPEEIKNEVEKSNKSIQYAIQKHAKREMEYIRKYDSIIARNRIFKNEASGIFGSIVFV